MFFFQQKIFCFLSLSVFHVNAEIKSKERIGFVVVVAVVYLYKSGWLCNLPSKSTVLEMQNFIPGLNEEMDERTGDFLRTKIFWMHRYLNFLTHGAPVFDIIDDMVDDDDGDVVDTFVKGVVVVPAAFVHNVDDIAVVLPVPSKLLVETPV